MAKRKIKIDLFCDGVDYSKPSEDRPCYLELDMTGGVKIYVSRELKKQLDNIVEDEKEQHLALIKCAVPGKNGKLIKCQCKCSECPYSNQDQVKKLRPVSLEQLREDDGFDAASDEDTIAEIYLQERKEKMWSEIHSLSKEEQTILDLWSKNTDVREIANKINKSKSYVAYEIKRIIEILQSKCKGY